MAESDRLVGEESPRAGDRGRLQRHLLRELIEANLLGASIIAFFYLVFQVDELPVASRTAMQVMAGAMLLGFLLVLYLSYRITSPLVTWLRAESPAPPPSRLQIAVVVQPAVQALLVLTLWAVAAVAFATAEALTSDEAVPLRFFVTLMGTLIGGVATAAITYLRVEHTWREWIPTFFPGVDAPTRLPLPSRGGLASRLHVAFVLGTVLPLLAVGMAASVGLRLGTPVNATQITWFLVIAGIVVGAILSVNIRRSITQPIHRIQEAMEKVSRGDLATMVPVDRVDELGRLESGFNQMMAGLRQREDLEQLLNRQVGDKVAERAIRSGPEADIGGEIRRVTALFVDLVAFSTVAESASPGALAALLNVVFGVIVDAVESRDGIVNKFQGDAVLAIFGAPENDRKHAEHALEAAEAIASGLEAVNLDFGIGVSTGEVFAGNVGTETRYEYTVIGDPVNEAARLQELTRMLERRVLLSGATAAAVRDAVGGRLVSALVPLEPVVLRGKTEATEVYSLSPELWRGPSVDVESTEPTSGEDGGDGAASGAVPGGEAGEESAASGLLELGAVTGANARTTPDSVDEGSLE
ncbi:MAG: HAMP domain-containing protein [Acidimicrobiia bacterium]|nr:HAMP domain-containing protein [Acidimicrobiia bacterium]